MLLHDKNLPSSSRFESSVLAPLGRLSNDMSQTEIGRVFDSERSFPLMVITCDRAGDGYPWVFISAGVHGEEPAGVHAALEFLEKRIWQFSQLFNFLVLPCVNPTGFERGIREGSLQVDINRNFRPDTVSPENLAVMKYLRDLNRSFLFGIDLHEIDSGWEAEQFQSDDNPREFYLYETCHDKQLRMGRQMVDAASQFGPFCEWSTIYKDLNDRGLVSYPEANGNPIYAQATTLDEFIFNNFTKQSFTTETPIIWSLEQRVKVQLAMLETALQLRSSGTRAGA
jgi:hypothetical protein